ncbi:MAG: outer membrane protein OmpA-like peptidoglycan-associated protein [Polaribacter sp.]|jgi:outer membrane protein OmpA-like peptidoglycan-associated protein
MKNIQQLVIIFALFLSSFIHSQNNLGFSLPTTNAERNQKCNYFSNAFKEKPKEVGFNIRREGNKLFFSTNDKKWWSTVFKKSGDGIAIDVVSKSRYACGKELEVSQIKGTVLRPVFAQKLMRGFKARATSKSSQTFVGTIPDELLKEELEFNILFLSNKMLCRYQTIYNLESYPWELLDMGVYLDSLMYKDKKIRSSDSFITKYKTLKFSIPFEKNKAEYSSEDIKPLYDSLRLTDFNIKKIQIKAYASIEGSLKRNLELQEKRANSIVKSLQTFQKPNIVTEISSSENWVEFLNDVSKTKYKKFAKLSKQSIKQKVVGTISKALEKYLKNHRKAVITLELEKKDKYKNMSKEMLVGVFNNLILKEDIQEALVVQNSIFEKLKDENSPDLLRELNVPKQIKFIPILNKNSIFKYLLNVSYAKIAFDELKKLENLDPKSKNIKYNLVVVKFVIWKNNWEKIAENDFKREILKLKSYGITQNLIDRMLVNFHIVKAEKNSRQRKYVAKDASVAFIINTYKNFNLSNYDYLSLAQFLTYYSHTAEATEVLEGKVRTITVDEDLLFYYLNLTIINDNAVASQYYRTIMLNAITMNKERFCGLFNPSLEKGVTFQLLKNNYLKDTYCENCAK